MHVHQRLEVGERLRDSGAPALSPADATKGLTASGRAASRACKLQHDGASVRQRRGRAGGGRREGAARAAHRMRASHACCASLRPFLPCLSSTARPCEPSAPGSSTSKSARPGQQPRALWAPLRKAAPAGEPSTRRPSTPAHATHAVYSRPSWLWCRWFLSLRVLRGFGGRPWSWRGLKTTAGAAEVKRRARPRA